MTRSSEPQPVPLTGADCFLRAFDAETLRNGRASHLSQLVLRLGPGFDLDRFRSLIAEVSAANPILHAPIGRSLRLRSADFGAPVYRFDRAERCPLPRVEVHRSALPRGAKELSDEAPLPAVFFERLNSPYAIRKGDLLRFDVVRYADGAHGTDLAMTWLHMLLDGSGSENFVAFLERCFQGERKVDELPDDEFASVAPPGTFAERGRQAREWQLHMNGLGARGLHSLAGPLTRAPQALCYELETLTREQTGRVIERAKEKAGFLTPMLFYLAAAIRAHHAIFRARGSDPVSYVVPLPVDLRPKGGEGAIFRTRVSMIWFQVSPDTAEDLGALIEALKQQRRAMIKGKAIENGRAAMDLARYAPKRFYSWMARNAFKGELCSFFFAFTDEFLPGQGEFLGARIVNGFHAPSVPTSPGSGAIMSLRAERLNVTHVHQEGVFSESERSLFRAALLADLLDT